MKSGLSFALVLISIFVLTFMIFANEMDELGISPLGGFKTASGCRDSSSNAWRYVFTFGALWLMMKGVEVANLDDM